LRGKLTASVAAETPYGELAAALAEMGYDKKQAAEALVKADTELDPSVKGAEREQLLFKRAIVSLSGT
jgi:Holliday junction resolvasome RuvABC DNA-binding subunit